MHAYNTILGLQPNQECSLTTRFSNKSSPFMVRRMITSVVTTTKDGTGKWANSPTCSICLTLEAPMRIASPCSLMQVPSSDPRRRALEKLRPFHQTMMRAPPQGYLRHRQSVLIAYGFDFVDSIEEVFLSNRLPPSSDGIHSSFSADTPYVSS